MKNMWLKSAILAVAGVGLLAGSALANPFIQIENGDAYGTINYDTTGATAPEFSFTDLDGTLTMDLSTFDPSASYTLSLDWTGLQYQPNANSPWLDFPFGNLHLTSSADNPVMGDQNSGSWGALDWTLDWQNHSGSITYDFGNTGLFTNARVNLLLYVIDPDDNGIMTADMKWDKLRVELNPTAPVPEPATMLLFGTGLAGLAGVARRKKK